MISALFTFISATPVCHVYTKLLSSLVYLIWHACMHDRVSSLILTMMHLHPQELSSLPSVHCAMRSHTPVLAIHPPTLHWNWRVGQAIHGGDLGRVYEIYWDTIFTLYWGYMYMYRIYRDSYIANQYLKSNHYCRNYHLSSKP